MYFVAPNLGTYHVTPDAETPVDTFGVGSMVVDYDRELYPKNLWQDRQPVDHETYAEEVTEARIQDMIDRDIWVPPSHQRDS